MSRSYIIGVDEAGRGPLAGPVAVGVVCVPVDFSWELVPGVNDSKKISEIKRERIFTRANELKSEGVIQYHVALVPAKYINDHGIVKAVEKGIGECFDTLCVEPSVCDVRLDGLLRAPERYTNQRTIVGGDACDLAIGLASILAKVTRDAHLIELHNQYPMYGFDAHKGYGTKAHREMIQKHGMCAEHRVVYCKNVTNQVQ